MQYIKEVVDLLLALGNGATLAPLAGDLEFDSMRECVGESCETGPDSTFVASK